MRINKIIIPKQILTLLVLSVVLIIARVIVFHSGYFTYLLWNIFLASLPFMISSVLLLYSEDQTLDKVLLIIGCFFWLLFLPNAPYIVTDMIHLNRSHSAPLIYDTFLLFSSAWVGLLLGFYSLSHIEKIIRRTSSLKKTALSMGGIILLTSFGMYLGRFLRFNSWDVFSSPILFLKIVWNILSHPTFYGDAYTFTGIGFIFLYVSYQGWKYAELKA